MKLVETRGTSVLIESHLTWTPLEVAKVSDKAFDELKEDLETKVNATNFYSAELF